MTNIPPEYLDDLPPAEPVFQTTAGVDMDDAVREWLREQADREDHMKNPEEN